GSGGFGRGRSRGSVGCGDDSYAAVDKIGHERGQAIVAAVEPMVLDRHVLAFDVADFLEAFTKRSSLARGAFRRSGADEPNHRHHRLLRARRERPRCRRAAEQRDELATGAHSITSSARSRIDVGRSIPIALAVLRLMAISNFVA